MHAWQGCDLKAAITVSKEGVIGDETTAVLRPERFQGRQPGRPLPLTTNLLAPFLLLRRRGWGADGCASIWAGCLYCLKSVLKCAPR